MWSRSQQKDVVFALLSVIRWTPEDVGEMQRKKSSIKELVSKVSEAMEMGEYWVWCAIRQIEDPDAISHLDVIELLDIYKKCDNCIKKAKDAQRAADIAAQYVNDNKSEN